MYDDDLDDFTYELMEGICGKESMLFEQPPEEKPKKLDEIISRAKDKVKEQTPKEQTQSKSKEKIKDR